MTLEDYSLFGLRVRSEIPLPELFEALPGGAADVTITLGAVPVIDGSDGRPAVDGEALLLHISGIARYRIAGGDTIVVDPEPGVPDRNIRLYLLGSAFGALLHQRGLLPLHANAIEVDGKAVAFMGASGAGKSTLAAWFHDRGHRVISDDVCVVCFKDDGRPFACPGLPRLRLWQDALELGGRGAEEFERSYAGSEKLNKFDVPITPGSAGRNGFELAAIYELVKAETFAIDRLEGLDATEAVFAHTYRGGFLAATKGERGHWEASLRLVRGTPIYRLTRPWSLGDLDAYCREILVHAQHAAAG